MDPNENGISGCLVCMMSVTATELVLLKCGHTFCSTCLQKYISVLRVNKCLTPEKLKCLFPNCDCEIEDDKLLHLFPGDEGYMLKMVRKCYKESTNPSVIIFNCNGYMSQDRKTLIEKTPQMSREEHSILTNKLFKEIRDGGKSEGLKGCNNIHTFNCSVQRREKSLQCYICGVTYCFSCLEFSHDGACIMKVKDPMVDIKTVKQTTETDQFESYIMANQMTRCLNVKCGLPIAKEEGCFWVKCRCSWEMCYPCKKLWGDCEHFSKYPYQKFTPPPEWMVRALNLF